MLVTQVLEVANMGDSFKKLELVPVFVAFRLTMYMYIIIVATYDRIFTSYPC